MLRMTNNDIIYVQYNKLANGRTDFLIKPTNLFHQIIFSASFFVLPGAQQGGRNTCEALSGSFSHFGAFQMCW